ncbi:lipoprotein [Actinobacillus equuli]|nr:lipoprotein [Actinobacillus equuli]
MKNTTVFRGLLLSGIALAVAACGNLSKVTDEGTTENPVFPKSLNRNLTMMVLSSVHGQTGKTFVRSNVV